MLVIIVALAAGCASVPATKVNLPGGASLESPKDFLAEDVDVQKNADGSYTFKAKRISSKNSPEVMGTAAAANAETTGKLIDGFKLLLETSKSGATGAMTGGVVR